MVEGIAGPADRHPRDVFVGREPELRELLSALPDVESGRGRLFLVGGEPGIGKSRLADELASRARQRDFRVLLGRAWEDAGAPPYWMWVQALRAYLRAAPVDEVARLLGSRASEIAQMVPDVRDLIPDLPPAAPIESDSARFQLFDATTAFLRRAAQDSPLLIILDDLQAADTPSLLLLRFLGSQLSDIRSLVVGTYRDVELTEDHPLRRTIDELARAPSTRLLPLRGLGQDAVAEYIHATAGQAPRGKLAATLHDETGGNPLFVGEAIRLLEAEGRFDELAAGKLHLTVPAGIRDVIIRRLSHIDHETVELLTAAAVLGPEFSADVLRRIRGYSPEQQLSFLEGAVRSGLILPARGTIGRYRFAHDLVRETLYGGLSATDRVSLHRQVAEALEELFASALDGHLAELAHHYYEAAGGGYERVFDNAGGAAHLAVAFARRAGDLALRSLAFEEAARLYTMALAVLEGQPGADEGEQVEILLALGDAQARAGDLYPARDSFLKAASVARGSANGPQLARAAFGYGGRFVWIRAGNDPHLIPLLQEALVMLGGADDRLRVRLLTRLAGAWRDSPEHRDQSAALSQQAVEMAHKLGDPTTLGRALIGRYGAIWWPENAEERLHIGEEALSVAEATQDRELTIDAHMAMAMTYADLGRMAQARAALDRLMRAADELGQPAQLWVGRALRTSFALMSGDFAGAEKSMAEESEPGSPTTPVEDDVSAIRMHEFLLRREQGRLSEAEASIRDAAERFPWYPVHRAALAWLLIDLGRLDEARAQFRQLSASDFGAFVRDNEWLLTMCLCADVCHLLGDHEAARPLYEQLHPFAGAHAIGHAEGSVGTVDRYLGLLAETLDRVDDAERHFLDAVTENERLDAHPWVAHTLADLAALLERRRARDDVARAMELRERSLAFATRLGMTALAHKLQGWTLRGEAAPEAASAAAAAADLRREGEYWTVRFGAEPFRVRDMKGLRYLARLLERPGQEIHVLDLVTLESPAPARSLAREPGLEAAGRGAVGPGLDAQAKAEYRARLEELQEEIAQAEQWYDPEREAHARRELEQLADQLAGAVGLGGRDRPAGSAAERARVSVTRAIHAALARLAEHDKELHAHLRATVRTGTYCSYQPDPRVPLEWRL